MASASPLAARGAKAAKLAVTQPPPGVLLTLAPHEGAHALELTMCRVQGHEPVFTVRLPASALPQLHNGEAARAGTNPFPVQGAAKSQAKPGQPGSRVSYVCQRAAVRRRAKEAPAAGDTSSGAFGG